MTTATERADWLLYEHDDGRRAVAPSAEAATFANGEPAWHRVGPVEVHGVMACVPPVDADGESITPQRLIAWLDAKFARHSEEEDKWAADYIRATAGALPQAPSGETMTQREEVCAAWADLPDDLRKDARLTRLYHALGGPRMDDPAEADPHGVTGTHAGLSAEECDKAAAQAMDRIAAAKGMHALDLNPDITAHWTLRRELIRAGYALARGVDVPPIHDAVWEALQRLIENAASLGPSSQEDAMVVARWRGQFVAARERASGVGEV